MNPLLLRASFLVVSGAALLFTSSAAAAEGEEEQPAPATSAIVIPATAGASHPIVVGRVKEGQVVTLHIGNVRWGGGGTEGRRTTSYRGYPHRNEHNGFPWMALVASVNHKDYLPDRKDYTFTVREDGVLVVFANDDNPAGNTGKGEVTVTVSEKSSGSAFGRDGFKR